MYLDQHVRMYVPPVPHSLTYERTLWFSCTFTTTQYRSFNWMIPENSDTKLHKIHRFLIQLVGKYTSVHRFFPNGQQRNFKKGISKKRIYFLVLR